MQSNQSFLQQYLLFDFNDEYQAENYSDTEEIDIIEDLNDDDDCFNQNYAEFNSQNQSLDDSINTSEPYVNVNFDDNNGDSFLSTTINYADYDDEDKYSTVEDNEIHYLNLIRKSEIAVSQRNAVLNQSQSQNQNQNSSHRYSDDRQEENVKTYKIVCIDDSKAVVKAIEMYLDDKIFSVIGINDPLKALMQVVRLKPDLILLDITMPTLDGYELCSLLRKHSSLKNTPVVMVTGKKGIIDRVKAKMVKASDYLTKPFKQKDLLKIVFKYID
ncbi:MAG: response regulator [Rivularia sp. (in: cyanobacteria)]